MGKLEVIPLGGIGEFGMNCMALRYEDEMIVVDAGMGFPEETPYGVDICIPDFDFLEEYRQDLTALILTHGHEDHIGALPYILKKYNLPVYASRYTLGLADSKLEEHKLLNDVLLHRVEANQIVQIGSHFRVEFITASHSLVDCFSLAIETPCGTIIHTGDYKIDETPVIGKPMDLKTLREYGDKGVLALFADSTNATVPGRTPSEKAVIPAFEEIFEQTEGRIFVAAFASSLHRIQIVLDVAWRYGRKVCVLGRSMQKNVDLGDNLGLLDFPEELIVNISQAKALRRDEVVYLVTGSQGENRAALWQLATQIYKGLTIENGDTVLLSARIIPGNEKMISRLIGHLYKRGANIIEEKRRLIHVSGHASQEDIKILTEAVRPKYVVPIHGEYRMLFRHKEFVKNHLGYAEENVMLIENGDVLEFDGERAVISNKLEIGRTFIDESGFQEIGEEIIRERKRMAYEGVISLTQTLDNKTKKLIADPQISPQGVLRFDGNNGLMSRAQQIVKEAVNSVTKAEIEDTVWFKEHLRVSLKRFMQKQTGTRPVIIPNVVEV
ncbi:MAG: ribonuclease J [Pyrinomonadaceae bacterium]|nr:ribonuclease J [Pyrinomonadaceae bacterium]